MSVQQYDEDMYNESCLICQDADREEQVVTEMWASLLLSLFDIGLEGHAVIAQKI